MIALIMLVVGIAMYFAIIGFVTYIAAELNVKFWVNYFNKKNISNKKKTVTKEAVAVDFKETVYANR